MSFVYDADPLFDGKSWYSSPVAPSNKSLSPDEWNSTQTYLDDIRNALIAAEYFGMAQSSEAVSDANTAKLRLSTGNKVQASVNGAAYADIAYASAIASSISCFCATGPADNASAAIYVVPHTNGNSSPVEVGFIVPFACTISNLYVKLTSYGTHHDNETITVRKNNSDQTLTCTLTTPATTGNDTTHSFTAAAGDEISFKIVSGMVGGYTVGGTGSGVFRISVKLVPT